MFRSILIVLFLVAIAILAVQYFTVDGAKKAAEAREEAAAMVEEAKTAAAEAVDAVEEAVEAEAEADAPAETPVETEEPITFYLPNGKPVEIPASVVASAFPFTLR